MADTAVALKRGMTRVFVIENQAGPTHVPYFLDFGVAGAFEQAFGDIKRIEVPSPDQYGQYEVVGEITGAIENAKLPLTYQTKVAVSYLFELARKRCPYDIQVHAGSCEDPRDFDAGWEIILNLERARSTNFKTEDLGSLTSGDEEKVTEESEASAIRAYYIAPMSFSKRAEADVTSSVIAVNVCDKPSCGECGTATDGCQIVFAVMDPAGSSPGLKPEVVFTSNGYLSDSITAITTFAIGDNPDDAACVGPYYVVVSADSGGYHVALKDAILTVTDVWQKITSGFVALKGPQAITSLSPRDTWIAGKGGYIYFTDSPLSGVVVQDAGSATTQDLNDIDAYDTNHVVAVGAANAVVFTENGVTWQSRVGPAVGVVLNCVAMRGTEEWWVGTATGKLFYTLNKGLTWTEKLFSGSGAGSVAEIKWASDTVGFMAHNTGTAARILRTISGGYTWYVAPERASSTMPTALSFAALAVCLQEVNVVYAGGLATGGVDGVLVKGSS
jgi:hypothetical protein